MTLTSLPDTKLLIITFSEVWGEPSQKSLDVVVGGVASFACYASGDVDVVEKQIKVVKSGLADQSPVRNRHL